MIYDKKNSPPKLDSQICIASENRSVVDFKAYFVAFKT